MAKTPEPERASINVPGTPDFFQQEDEAALRQRVRWLDDKFGLDSQFLSKVLHQSKARLEKWQSKATRLSAESEGILSGLWQLVLHLLSYYGNEEKRVRQLLEQSIPESQSSLAAAPRDQTVSPSCPPWYGAPSLKSYLEEHGVDAIDRVNRWLMSLRFGDPYSMTSEATTWP